MTGLTRGVSGSRLVLTTLILVLLGGVAPIEAPGRSDISTAKAAQGAKEKGRLIAQRYIIASRGGRLRARNGAELRVPPRVMRRNGVASIRRFSRRRFDVHISAPWKGSVTVMLPVGNAKDPAVVHLVRGRWIVEPLTVVKGRAQLRVRGLSVFDTDEYRRYAQETVDLSYTAFAARRADFVAQGCEYPPWHKKRGKCRKPWPYNSFDWSTDGCSRPTGALLPLGSWKTIFNAPCELHDFGYRNFGNGLTLERNEGKRMWIDRRFEKEMQRVCSTWSIGLQRAACHVTADAMYTAVAARFLGSWFWPVATQSPAPRPSPSPRPTPAPAPALPVSAPTPAPGPGSSPAQDGGATLPPRTFAEQETPNHPVNTFTNYHNASGQGPAIAAGQWVQVSCKVYDPTIQSVNPDGYWYRIASAPWNNAYYSPANTFMNGDPYGGPYTHNTDFAVPNC